MTETGTTTKTCTACGKSVHGQKRMKDSQGRYWCMSCGEEDKRKKLMAGGATQCSGCAETFPAHQLSAWGNRRLCAKCSRNQSKGPGIGATIKGLFAGGGGGGGQTDKGKLIKMLVAMAVLAIIAIWQFKSK